MKQFAVRVLLCATAVWIAACSEGDGPSTDATNDSNSDDGDRPGAADGASRDRDGATSPAVADGSRPVPDASAGKLDAGAARADAAVESPRDAARAEGGASVSDGGPGGSDGGTGAAGDASAAAPFALSSSVVAAGMRLAMKHRCADMQQENASPPLDWSEGPSGTLSYALVMRDVTRASVVMHWLIYDIPAGTTELPERVPSGYQPAQPAGAKQGPSYKPALGYQGPCAPGSGTNTYEFTVYALDVALLPSLSQSSTATQIVAQIEMHDLASAKLSVTSSAAN
jgi:Raf kinase inhibitor-like YbhB/YbcL family protein